MIIAIITASDSLKIVELRQTVELITHRLDSLAQRDQTFWSAMPWGLNAFGIVMGLAIVVLTTFYVIGIWDKIAAPAMILKLMKHLRTVRSEMSNSKITIDGLLEYIKGTAQYQMAWTLKDTNTLAFFHIGTNSIILMLQSGVNIGHTVGLMTTLSYYLSKNSLRHSEDIKSKKADPDPIKKDIEDTVRQLDDLPASIYTKDFDKAHVKDSYIELTKKIFAIFKSAQCTDSPTIPPSKISSDPA